MKFFITNWQGPFKYTCIFTKSNQIHRHDGVLLEYGKSGISSRELVFYKDQNYFFPWMIVVQRFNIEKY